MNYPKDFTSSQTERACSKAEVQELVNLVNQALDENLELPYATLALNNTLVIGVHPFDTEKGEFIQGSKAIIVTNNYRYYAAYNPSDITIPEVENEVTDIE